ncbi:MAG: hypothetical protein C0483_00070 [Pirellula sp.]|nr:hypothetical protein [Pirellula sp.]
MKLVDQSWLAATAILVLALSLPPRQAMADDAVELRLLIAAKLDSALLDAEKQSQPEQQIAVLKPAAAEALRAMTANVFVQDLLRKVEQAQSDDPRPLAKQWRNAVTEARDVLRFEPLIEAPLPVGFPKPTPVGEIRVQQYPKYRLARTDMTLMEGRAFWTLFNHIKQREIAMTAPVEMSYTPGKDGKLDKSSMSFLYRSTEQGQLEVDGKVAVVDVPAQLAVSIGLQGDATKEKVNDAKQRLEAWLQIHGDEFEPAGALRVLGYNSPFVADRKKLTEVQIPVSSKRPAAAGPR